MKTLNTIQNLFKIGKIICKIIFILSLVGAIASAVGIISLVAIPDGIEIDGITVSAFIEKNAGLSIGTCFAVLTASVIICFGEAILCKIAENYFTNEQSAGTPFTLDGAKELIRLGIFTICIPIGTQFISSMVCAVMKLVLENVADTDLSAFGSGSIGFGVMFIIAGLLCRYGAEIKAENHKDEEYKED